jgi:hypothetical protein
MARSAQDKFNEYLDECRETNDAVNEFVKASYENYNRTYSYTSGYLESMLKEVIIELPKARRAEIRKRFLDMAQTQKNELLIKTLKESENA